MVHRPLRAAVVGSGMISGIYLENMIRRFNILEVDCVCAAHMESARRRASEFGIAARTFEDVLADDSIGLVVNLTPAPAHKDIIRRALAANKHVYTEKTMTLDHETALELKALAESKGLWLGSAPDTFLGSALQTARRAIDEGLIGEVNSFAAASNRDNRELTSFYRFLNLPGGGVGYDYAVYYLTALVSLLGPVESAAAVVRAPYPTHIDRNPDFPTFGQPIPTPNESEICAVLRLKSGVGGTVHFNNDSLLEDQAFFAIYGTDGILYLPDPNTFGGRVRLLRAGQAEPELLENRFAFTENSRGVGPADMAWAIRENRPCRASAAMACHVLELVDALVKSDRERTFISLETACERPEPLRPGVDLGEDSLRMK